MILVYLGKQVSSGSSYFTILAQEVLAFLFLQIKIIMLTAGTVSDHVVVEAMKMQDYQCFWQSQRVKM